MNIETNDCSDFYDNILETVTASILQREGGQGLSKQTIVEYLTRRNLENGGIYTDKEYELMWDDKDDYLHENPEILPIWKVASFLDSENHQLEVVLLPDVP